MRQSLIIGVFWLLATGPCFPQGSPTTSGGPGDSPFRVGSDQLEGFWTYLAKATNQWAEALHRAEGWGTLASASTVELRARAEQGIGAAQLRLGYVSLLGQGVERDEAQGVRWLTKAAQQNLAPAQFLLGEAMVNGLGASPDFAGGVDWLDKSAAQGFAEAELLLGLCYLNGGPGVNRAPTRGLKWIVRAAEQGKPLAQQLAGECYAIGNGTQSDAAEAGRWFRRAADQGLATAQALLAGCYLTGQGVDRNQEEAYRWYERAADQGLGAAAAAVARCCAKGIGVPRDPARAMIWWNKAAAAEYVGAQFHLGLGYYSGAGVGRDLERAAACFQKDAQHNHVGAQLYLGLCFWRGDGFSRDIAQAGKWWGEACIQGIVPWRYAGTYEALGDADEVEVWWREVADQATASLQCCLAESYHFGHGVPANDSQAAAWYRKAAARGDLVALKRAAWLLATSSDPKVRDGAGAIEFGQKAVAATDGKDASIQDTLAAAYAEARQFEQAIRTERRAVELAHREDEKQEYQTRLKLYEAFTPFHATP